MKTEELIYYYFIVKEDMHEYRSLVNSKWWEPNAGKVKYQDHSSLLISYTLEIGK